MVFLPGTTRRIGWDMPLEQITASWCHIQGHLFPWLRDEIGPLTEQHERLVIVLEMARVEALVPLDDGGPGRPADDRQALARAFTAKTVLNLPTTAALIERLTVDPTLRRLCGWERAAEVPKTWTFSRANAEFADAALAERTHAALIKRGSPLFHVGSLRSSLPAIR